VTAEVHGPDGRGLAITDGSFVIPQITPDRVVAQIGMRLSGGADGMASVLQARLFKSVMSVDLDPATINSPTTLKVFQRMSQIRKLVDKDFSGRDWNVASGMVISGKAGYQIMGDWAKGEFVNAKKVPGKDFLCYRFPGTQGMASFNTDQFAMFKLADPQKTAAQLKLASDIMDPGFQSAFNVVKGSAPARFDVSDAAFDDCGKKAIKDAAEANKNNTLVGSIAHGHAVPASIKNAFYDVITRHFNGQIDDKKAVAELASAAKS